MTCTVEGCSKPIEKKMWCGMHYQRWRKHGDVHTTVKTPNGEAIRYFEQTVLAYDGDDCLTWPYCCTNRGYAKLGQAIVARMVCERVNGPPPTPKHEAAHSCNNGADACVTKAHVAWKTHAENEADKIANGTSNRGERSANAKLTEKDVLEIRSRLGSESLRSLGRSFGVSLFTIKEIRDRKRWAWLDQEAA